jgi:3-hydroxybutyryl-CoA dehydrogenase
MNFIEKGADIGLIGAGTMGTGIAQAAALNGYNVFIYDEYPDSILRASEKIKNDLEKLVAKNKITITESGDIRGRITYVEELREFSDCKLIIEAVIEDLKVKQNLFTSLEEIINEDCILATNTSSLSVASIASACKNIHKVIGIHFFNPAHIMPLVEIIPALTTDAEVVTISRKLIDDWGKTTVLAKDTPGFIVNKVARPFYGEALRIYEEGIADFTTIDQSMKELGKFRMGPFELMDFIGIDINYTVTATVFEQMFYDPRYRPSLTQKRLFDAGLFGRKTGKGFYNYKDETKNPLPEKNEKKGILIFERILAMLINEAADTLYMGIASRDDIDLAVTKGVNYPKGLLQWADDWGINNVVNNLQELQSTYQEDRYRICPLLNKLNKSGKGFYN